MKVTTSTEGETFIHKVLWQVVEREIEAAEANRQGSFYDDPVAMTFAFLALEAYLNFVGERLDPKLWHNERKHFRASGFAGKLRAVMKLAGIAEPDHKTRPHVTIWALKELRDRIAHAKPEKFSGTHEHDADELTPWDKNLLHRRVTHENACNAKEDVKTFAATLDTAAAKMLPDDIWFGRTPFDGPTQYSTGQTKRID